VGVVEASAPRPGIRRALRVLERRAELREGIAVDVFHAAGRRSPGRYSSRRTKRGSSKRASVRARAGVAHRCRERAVGAQDLGGDEAAPG